jgi:hypothetical protein
MPLTFMFSFCVQGNVFHSIVVFMFFYNLSGIICGRGRGRTYVSQFHILFEVLSLFAVFIFGQNEVFSYPFQPSHV